MGLWNISSDLVPWQHKAYVRDRTYRPWNDIELLEVTPEWVYGAYGTEEIINESNAYVAREELAAYSDGMGGSCADHIVTSRGMMAVPLWRDDDKGPSGGYHPAAIVGLSLLARMDDYPLLDEQDYSERETNAWIDYLEDEFRCADNGEREDEEIDSHRARFMEYAFESLFGYYSVWDVPSKDIERAYTATRMETMSNA